MGDFAQSGVISTLQRLGNAGDTWLEEELCTLAEERPIGLILPCHASDLGQPALLRLREELSGARWLREIVFSLNGLEDDSYREACAFFAELPQQVHVLWNDGPQLASALAGLLDGAPWELSGGKGFNVWTATGLLCATSQPEIIVTQDCDVKSFRRSSLARLCYACASQELNFSLAKMYYPRVTDRLYGRISRLFVAPLLRALVRVAGRQPLLTFLESFRYPLAGEVALRRTLAQKLSWPSGWALEIGMLSEAFGEVDPHVICQVDGGDEYDHKHQVQVEALTGMCRAIAESLLAHLDAMGTTCGPASRLELRSAFQEESMEAVRGSAALARINRLPFDAHAEQALADSLGGALAAHTIPMEQSLPAWETLLRERPQAVRAFVAAATGASA